MSRQETRGRTKRIESRYISKKRDGETDRCYKLSSSSSRVQARASSSPEGPIKLNEPVRKTSSDEPVLFFFLLFLLEILYNKEICHLQLKKRRFIRLSGKFYYKSGQRSADFITIAWVHKPSSCPTDYTFCFSYRFLLSSNNIGGGYMSGRLMPWYHCKKSASLAYEVSLSVAYNDFE